MANGENNNNLEDLKMLISAYDNNTNEYLVRLGQESERWRKIIEQRDRESNHTARIRIICTSVFLTVVIGIYLLGYFFSPYLYNNYNIEGDNSQIINGEGNTVESSPWRVSSVIIRNREKDKILYKNINKLKLKEILKDEDY